MSTPALNGGAWRKSSRSADTSNCVEVAFTPAPAVRDSKNPTGPMLAFPVAAWSTFVSLRPGEGTRQPVA